MISVIFSSIYSALSQGVLWGILALGVYLTYKVLDIADLTVDGSFVTGAAVCAISIINGVNPFVSIVLAFIAGCLAGTITGILHTKFNIPAILAGILTQISLWSINLAIMNQQSNIALLKSETVFSKINKIFNITNEHSTLYFGILISLVLVVVLYLFFGTELGTSIRATGNNEKMIKALGVNTNITKIITLALSNGLVAISGALVCQQQKFTDINMGTGAIVTALASIVIGEIIFSKFKSFFSVLYSTIIGSCIYYILRAVVLMLGLPTNYMKLLTALVVVIALYVPTSLNKLKEKKDYSKGGMKC